MSGVFGFVVVSICRLIATYLSLREYGSLAASTNTPDKQKGMCISFTRSQCSSHQDANNRYGFTHVSSTVNPFGSEVQLEVQQEGATAGGVHARQICS